MTDASARGRKPPALLHLQGDAARGKDPIAGPSPWLYVIVKPQALRLLNKIRREEKMLTTLAVILIILWLLGIISSYTLGGWIHILLVVAIIAVLLRLISGRPGPPAAPL